MLRLYKISGRSLEPLYEEGDFVLVSKIPFWLRVPRLGDVVVARHARLGVLIKRVERIAPGGELYLAGTSPSSSDSDAFGLIPVGDVIGKVVGRVRRAV